MTKWIVDGTLETYSGSGGVDLIDFAGSGGASGYIDASAIDKLTISGRGTYQTVELQGSAGYDTLYVYSNGLAKVDFSLMTFGPDWAPSDRLVFQGTSGAETIVGSPGNDTIGGLGGTDSLRGGAGYDTLTLYDYADTDGYRITNGNRITDGTGTTVTFAEFEALILDLGAGDDTITGLSGRDGLYGGAGDDTFDGAAGNDLLRGDVGNDYLTGGSENDSLYGGDGADVLDGGVGNDVLFGDSGVDQLYGGAGNDTYRVTSSQDRVYEFEGFNSLDQVISTVSYDLAKNANGFDAGEIEVLTLSGGDLNGSGNAAGNDIDGTTGANVLRGRGGADDLDVKVDGKADTVVFRSAAESTGAAFDTVSNLDVNAEDRLDIVVGDGIDVDSIALRSGGSLSKDSFDKDVAAKLNKSFDAGGGVQAFLWDPEGGDLDLRGGRYLVVDLNDSGSYEAGQDLVVLMLALSGTLDTSDFVKV